MKKKAYFFFAALCTLLSCGESENLKTHNTGIELVVLGTIQDAGSPQIGCKKKCCKDLLSRGSSERMVVSLGVIDHNTKQQYLFEATPDFPFQLHHLQRISNHYDLPNGIFITHAHIGHYTGLMHLGKEAMNSKDVKVYVMSEMRKFLTQNGPWSQLVSNSNINLVSLEASKEITLNKSLSVTPFLVPHRGMNSLRLLVLKLKAKTKRPYSFPTLTSGINGNKASWKKSKKWITRLLMGLFIAVKKLDIETLLKSLTRL